MKKKKTKSMLILALLLLGITVGYAVLSTNLSINGVGTINKPTWDIHFENIVPKSGSVTPTTAANISNEGKTVSYAVTLSTPGDYYEFNVDVKNAGTIDGMIESITSTVNNQPISNLPSYVEYYVTYSDGIEIGENQLLTAGSKLTYTVHIGFKKDINPEDLPGSNQTYNLNMGFTDTQAGSEATPKPYYIYTTDYSSTGMEVSRLQRTYTSPSGIIGYTGHNFFERLLIDDGIITDTYLGFIYGGKEHYLKAYDSEVALANANTLIEVFGEDNCGVTQYDDFECVVGDIRVTLSEDGRITGSSDSTHAFEFNPLNDGGYCQGNW